MKTQEVKAPNPTYLGYEIAGYKTLEDHAREGHLGLRDVLPSRVTLVYVMGDKVIRVPMGMIEGSSKKQALSKYTPQSEYPKEGTTEEASEELLSILRSVPRN